MNIATESTSGHSMLAAQEAMSNKKVTNLLSKTLVGNYRLDRKIGQGSMGVIYQGEEISTGRQVAIKVFELDGSTKLGKDIIKSSFVQEVFTGGCLDHRNIVTFYDADQIENQSVIIMEPLPGSDLRQYQLEGNFLSVKEVLNIGIQCANGLQFAHDKQVIHLDIKPSNLIYDNETGSLKITDFGVAHYVGTARATDKILGSPSYMSPEQLTGRPVDGRSDLFSLGVVLFHLLTGRLPFISPDMREMMKKIITQPHPALSSLRCHLPPSLENVINTLLEKKLGDRYQQAEEVSIALDVCMQELKAGLK